MFTFQARSILRQKVKAALLHKTAAKERVGINVHHIAEEADRYPYIEIATPREKVELSGHSLLETRHTVSLVIDVTLASANDLFAELDALAMEVERLLLADPDLEGLLLKEVVMGKDSEGAYCVGRLSLNYEASYTKDVARDMPENLKPFAPQRSSFHE